VQSGYQESLRVKGYFEFMKVSSLKSLMFACLMFAFIVSPLHAQTAQPAAATQTQTAAPVFDVQANYTKREVPIPMRDGVKLFTSIYEPKDKSQKYPVMLNRTPYSVAPYGADKYKTALGPSSAFMSEKYIFVYQDVRGRYMSEGDYANVRPFKADKKANETDDNSDAYDTIEWVLKNIENDNGRVGIWGISYPGFYTSMAIINSHPAIKAASPQAPIGDWFIGDDFHHNGAFFLPHAFNFYTNFGRPRPQPTQSYGEAFKHGTPDGYDFFLRAGTMKNLSEKYMKDIAFWNEVMQHPNYDEFWRDRNILPKLKGVKAATMTVGGWFDAEDLYGALKTYDSIEKLNPGINNTLVMGPWFHGGWARGDGDRLGYVSFAEKTSLFYRDNIEFPFFNFYLKDKGALKLPEAYIFNTGANRWLTFENYPPRAAGEMTLYLNANNSLTFDAPTGDDANAFDEYISDPAKPVPFISNIAIGMTREYMTDDQRFAARRPDVLVYETEPLAKEMTVCGAITPSLNVSTSGTDSDYIFKLIDVFPDNAPDDALNPPQMKMGGYQMLVRGEPFRARFRNSFSKPEAMIPGKPTKIQFEMPDACHTFKQGHRVMVQVQSTWFPLINRNPQKYVENINFASESDYQKATQRVYRSRALPSSVSLRVLP